jgi:uncharacterized membrane protein
MKIYKLLTLLSLAGLLISLYLAYEYSKPYDMTCFGDLGDGAANSCQQVRDSKYSELYGISLPYLGSLFFIFLTFYLILPVMQVNLISMKKYKTGLMVLISIAALMELYLMYLQFFVIGAVCSWCAVLSVVVFLMFVIIAVRLWYPNVVGSEKAAEGSAEI